MKVIAITGASAGIGRATAHAFAKSGARIGLIARSEKALEDTKAEVEKAGGQALVLPCDISDAEAVEQAAQKLEDHFGPIDVWINSAMISVFSPFEKVSADEYRRVTDVTYHGFVYGTMAALRRMKPRNRGLIIQVGSALAYRSIPLQAAYCGAKHAIKGFTDSIRSELHYEKSAVEISMVQLPAFNTPQFNWVRLHLDKRPQPLPPIHAPALAGEAIVWAAENPQREVWVGWPTFQAILGHKVFPGFLDRYMAKQAWDGQLTDKDAEPDRKDNLFETHDELHSEKGPFTDQEVTKKPILWQVPNQNFWINSLGVLVLLLAFILGLILG